MRRRAERMDLSTFPGGELVSKGLADLKRGELTQEALLVLVASPRLKQLGFSVPEPADAPAIPEHALYEAIERVKPLGAHSAYNALIRRIVSFANAYSQARRRAINTRDPS